MASMVHALHSKTACPKDLLAADCHNHCDMLEQLKAQLVAIQQFAAHDSPDMRGPWQGGAAPTSDNQKKRKRGGGNK